jgi:hypothetical protein
VTGAGSSDLTETALLPNVSPAPRDTERRWQTSPLGSAGSEQDGLRDGARERVVPNRR